MRQKAGIILAGTLLAVLAVSCSINRNGLTIGVNSAEEESWGLSFNQAQLEGNGVVAERRTVFDVPVSRLSLSGTWEVTVECGAGEDSCNIITEENLLPYVVQEFRDGRLVVKWQTSTGIRCTKPQRLEIKTSGSPSEVVVSGACVLTMNSAVGEKLTCRLSGVSRGEWSACNVAELELALSGASWANCSGEWREVQLKASGTSEAELSGSADALVIGLSGTSRANCSGEWREVQLKASGTSEGILTGKIETLRVALSGMARANVDQTIDAAFELSGASRLNITLFGVLSGEASGTSMVNYSGAKQVNSRLSGMASCRSSR